MIFCPGRCGRHSPWARRRWQSPSGAVSPFFCPLLSHQRGFGEKGLGKRPPSWLRSLWRGISLQLPQPRGYSCLGVIPTPHTLLFPPAWAYPCVGAHPGWVTMVCAAE